MAFRTVVVSSHCKLEYSLNYLVYKTVDEIKRINLDEIHTLIIESSMVTITTSLMIELINKKIKVILCDEKKNPQSELIPYYGDSISTGRIQEQIGWTQDIKDLIWKEIIKEKIKNQAYVMGFFNSEVSNQILEFKNQVEDGDVTNREGHAAKVYFNNVFGQGFSRNPNHPNNIYLNYGYAILLSQFNKAIIAKGYLTQVGIHHKNANNPFNFSCDLMEPFRPIVDKKTLTLNEKNYKDELIGLLNLMVEIGGQKQTLSNAINIYCASIFRALNTGSVNEIKFFTSYEL